MPRLATVFSIFVASPDDVSPERHEIQNAVAEWNVTHSRRENIILEPVLWESHSRPELGDRPQAIINKQILEECDILIAIFWTRMGTPTGEEDSGTIEEIKNFCQQKKPVLLYFSNQALTLEKIDLAQFEKVKKFKSESKELGLIAEYTSIEELKKRVMKDISLTVGDLQKRFGFIPRTGISDNSIQSSLESLNKRIYIFSQRFEMELDRIFLLNEFSNHQSASYTYEISMKTHQMLKWCDSELWNIYGEMTDPVLQNASSLVKRALEKLTILKGIVDPDTPLGIFNILSLDYDKDILPYRKSILSLLESCMKDLDNLESSK